MPAIWTDYATGKGSVVGRKSNQECVSPAPDIGDAQQAEVARIQADVLAILRQALTIGMVDADWFCRDSGIAGPKRVTPLAG